MLSQNTEFPKELLVPIENEPYFLGRITLNEMREGFMVELDIVQKESMKIYRHVQTLYDQSSEDEGLNNGVETLARFLLNRKV